MTLDEITNYKLPKPLYRRFLMMTELWLGTRASPGSLMIKAHSGGNAAPFFWTGSPDDLPEFYRNIGNTRSIYCFPSTLFVVPHTVVNIRSLAIYYTSEILKVNPKGPFFLGGNCTAAYLTYEIGKVLIECGHKVDLMILCERDVCQKDLVLNLTRRLFWRIERFNRWLPEFKINPWKNTKILFVSKIINVTKYIIVLSQKLFKLNKPKVAHENQINHYAGNSHENELSEENGYHGLEPLCTMEGYSGKVHLIYIKWGGLGFYQFKFFQKYWKNLATGGSIFHIIEGKYHWPVDWNAIAKISIKLIEDIEAEMLN
jgi:hypothetical protein